MTSALFSPIRLAELELANRIVVSPMCQYSANDGVASDWHITHLGMLANSGAALMVAEMTNVERHGPETDACAAAQKVAARRIEQGIRHLHSRVMASSRFKTRLATTAYRTSSSPTRRSNVTAIIADSSGVGS